MNKRVLKTTIYLCWAFLIAFAILKIWFADEFGRHTFCLAMNMMYSDYCKVAQKFGADRPEFYAEMAKAFLKDKDFDGNGEEKLWLYYKCIVEQE